MFASIRRSIRGLGGGGEHGNAVSTLGKHRGSVRHICFSPCGRHAATASGDNTVHVWDLCEKTLKLTLGSVPENLTGGGVGTGHRHIVTCVCFSADSMFVASGSYDKTLRIWSVEDGSTLAIMSGHMQIVTSVQWQPSSSALLTSSVDSTVRLWRLSHNGDDDWTLFPWGQGIVLEFAFAHTQASFLSDEHEDSDDFHRRTNRQRKHIPEMKCELSTMTCDGPVMAALFTEDGKRIVAASSSGSIKVWDASKVTPSHLSEALLLSIDGPGTRVESLALSRTSLIAVGCVDASVHIYDLSAGVHVRRFGGFKGYPVALSFCNDHEDFLLACCGSPHLVLLHLSSAKAVANIDAVGRPITFFRFDRDQTRMICATGAHTVFLVSDARARVIAAMAALDAAVGCFPAGMGGGRGGEDMEARHLLACAADDGAERRAMGAGHDGSGNVLTGADSNSNKKGAHDPRLQTNGPRLKQACRPESACQDDEMRRALLMSADDNPHSSSFTVAI